MPILFKNSYGTKPKGRILCVTSNFPRWLSDSTTPFVLNLAEDLQRIGWKVDVLAPHAPGAYRTEVLKNVNVERFRYFWPETQQTVCYQGGALINLRTDKVNYLKLPSLIAFEWLNIFSKLIKGRYDLLHSHWILPQGFTGVLASRLLKIPHVTTVHGGDVFGLQGKALKKFKQFTLSNVDAVTVNSSVTEEAVLKLNQNLDELHRIPMGVTDKNWSSEIESEKIKKKYQKGVGPLLIFIGRLVEEKGVGDLIQAVKLLKKQIPDVSCLIVGEGQDRKLFENLVKKLRLSNRIFFPGWIEPEKIPVYLAAVDIFVGPSRHEAQGLTFIEAMMAKVPVIATRIGGIVDSVKHEETGLLVNEKAPEEIAFSVQRLINESGLSDKLKKNGYKIATSKFSRKASAMKFSHLFERLIFP
ncbi:glycosyltransferase [Desulfobacula sp.]|uniref:glycosyltransferase n=1 Tax=Desulfobacula sp. TaxID=2593537 RepID=UPI00261070EB|nr:glycosyltransferase [Desulfobacula sp.]